MRTELSDKTWKLLATSVSEIFVVPAEHLAQVGFHGLILFFIIMGFWLLDSLKDPIIAHFLGMEYQPTAKLFSVLFTLILVCIYDYTTTIINKITLFHVFSTIFGVVFMVLSALISDPDIGLVNRKAGPYRLTGWFFYCSVEAYGSLMVAMFWSFTNSIMDLERAKGTYGLIIAIAQVGAITGATLATRADQIGISQLVLLASMIVLSVSLLVKSYHMIFRHSIESSLNQNYNSSTTSEIVIMATTDSNINSNMLQPYLNFAYRFVSNFYDGLRLVLSYQYTLRLLALSCLYEIVVTVLDYEFKLRGALNLQFRSSAENVSGKLMNSSSKGYEDEFASLMGQFGQLTNFISLLVATFGFSLLVRRLGVRTCLLIFPIILLFSLIITNIFSSLSVLFVVVSMLKALIFSLNEPVKELLYIPTSQSIKYKAKAWIDVFGSRLAKALGSSITNQSHGDPGLLRSISELPCILIALSLVGVAWYIGLEFERYVRLGEVVGEDSKVAIVPANSSSRHTETAMSSDSLPMRNGLKPGDVGYDGYDLHLFEGVFEDDSDDKISHFDAFPELTKHDIKPSVGDVEGDAREYDVSKKAFVRKIHR